MRPATFGLLGALGLAGWIGVGAYEIVLSPTPPPAVQPPAPATPRLTEHLAFVVVDGLRYDIATNAALMPHFSAEMMRRASAEVWAGMVAMTSSAVLTYGTGQRGGFEQVARNLDVLRTPFDNWLQRAHEQGVSLMVAGDVAWPLTYGDVFDQQLLDPPGAAIDVDFNEQTFRDSRALAAKAPNVLIAHFVTPDHQGHAYGILSEQYEAHIRQFDQDLGAWLSELGREWTVVVTSDHGATNTGTHGMASEVTRRSPLYAYGPGIAAPPRHGDVLDQAELAGTLATLIGVSAPTHARGRTLVEWLDLEPALASAVACADVERASAVLAAEGRPAASLAAAREACAAKPAPEAASLAAREAVQALDEHAEAQRGLWSWRNLLVLGGGFLAALALAAASLGREASRRGLLPALGTAALSVALVFFLERLPGWWPPTTVISCFVAGGLLALAIALRPSWFARLAERRTALAACLAPGLLIATYPANLLPFAFAVTGLAGWLLLRRGAVTPSTRSPFTRASSQSPAWQSAGLLLLAPLAAFGASESLKAWFQSNAALGLWLTGGALLLWLLHRAVLDDRVAASPARGDRRATALEFALGAALCIPPLLARGTVTSTLGWLIIGGLGMAGLAAWFRGRPSLGVPAAAALILWLSRDFEVFPILWTVALAHAAGRSLARSRLGDGSALPAATRLIALSFAFAAVTFVEFAGKGGLEITDFNLSAGAFGDPGVRGFTVGVALLLKLLATEFLVLAALLQPLTREDRRLLSREFVAVAAARVGILAAHLCLCGGSFWTSLRVFSALPSALVFALGATLISAAATVGARRAAACREGQLAPALLEVDPT